jgi:Fe-Mn family superoxide dismutase
MAVKNLQGASERREPYAAQAFELKRPAGVSAESHGAHWALYSAYVEETNQVLATVRDGLARSERNGAAARPRETLARRLSFERNAVVLHELYFEQLCGERGQQAPSPSSVLMESMDSCFGGFGRWRDDVLDVASTRGVGWVITTWDPAASVLANVWVDLHHLSCPVGQRVIFALDLWEHAYWSDYGAKGRADFARDTVEGTRWEVVESRALHPDP